MNQDKSLFKWDRIMIPTKSHVSKASITLKPLLKRSSSIPKDLNINNNNNNNINRKASIESNDSFKRHNSSRPSIAAFKTRHPIESKISDTKRDLQEVLNNENARNLVELDLSNYNLKSLINLDKFVKLKVLNLACNNILKIENLTNFKHLNELKLYGNQIDFIENFNDSFVTLTSLQLQSNKIKKLDKCLNALKNLEYLRLDRNEITIIHSHEVSSLVNLIYLNISGNKLSSLSFINCLPNLEQLVASDCSLQKFEIDVQRCKKLSDLDLSVNKLCDEAFVSFENLRALCDLNLSSNQIKSLNQIAKVKHLKILNLSSNAIEIVDNLKNIQDLEILDLSCNQIKEWSQVECLASLENLIELDLKDNPFYYETPIETIRTLLPSTKVGENISLESRKKNLMDNNEDKDSHLADELLEFEREIDTINENFKRKFKEISIALDTIDDSCTKIRPNTIRSSTNLSRLQDALSFAKSYEN